MQGQNFIVREPLLDPKERVLGYELAWHRNGGRKPSESEASQLVDFIAEQAAEGGTETLLGDEIMFVEITPELLMHDGIERLPEMCTVFALRAPDIDAGSLETIKALRGKGYGISLRDVDLTTADKNPLSAATHVEVPVNAVNFKSQIDAFRSLGLPDLRLVARRVTNWQDFDLCAVHGLDAFVGHLHLTRRPGAVSQGLNPAQAMILQLMDLVRKNADARQLEAVLKRDAAISYKLLRYINSAGFGLGCEIQSLKHAVTLLGYSPLYRWLSVLLAGANNKGSSPILLQTAVMRGRFSELLGREFLPKGEADNLFVAGMFSLLDRILGVPMEDVLEKVQLSEEVTQALLSRQGIYGSFLALAEACELNSPEMESMATNLCVSPTQVNQAHLSALAWTQSIKL